MSQIVVGVDGSEGSRQALKWATSEAVLRSATLVVIHTYEPSTTAKENFQSAEQAQQVLSAARRSAEALVARLVEGVEAVEAEGHAIESHNTARTLVEMSEHADMLVVSSRGLGGFKSLMLGSVSQQCAHHAKCPVVIVRAEVTDPT